MNMEKLTVRGKTTGMRIRYARIMRGLTQKDLGKLCGMADSQIGVYERDESNPRPGSLKRVAEALGVPASDLLPERSCHE